MITTGRPWNTTPKPPAFTEDFGGLPSRSPYICVAWPRQQEVESNRGNAVKRHATPLREGSPLFHRSATGYCTFSPGPTR